MKRPFFPVFPGQLMPRRAMPINRQHTLDAGRGFFGAIGNDHLSGLK